MTDHRRRPRGWPLLSPRATAPPPAPERDAAALTRVERWSLVAVVLGSGLVFLDSTVISVALPAIGNELPSRWLGVYEAQSYVYTSYLLALSALLIVGGALADRRGRRRMFTIGMIGFGVTSALCGLATSLEALVAFRILQGATGALLVPGSLAIITECFSGEARGRAFGIWAGTSAATTIVGPLFGGVLVDLVSWRSIFLVNVPVAAVGVAITLRWVVESRDEEASARLDWASSIAVAVAVGGLSFGAIRGQQQQWEDPLAVVALVVGAIAIAALPILLRRADHPLVPLELFRSRNFNVTNLSTLFIYGGLYVTIYVLTVFVQGTLGYTATAAGVVIVPSMVFLAVFSARFGALAARHGARWFMASGPAVMGLGVLWLARIPVDSPTWAFDAREPATLLRAGGYTVDVLPAMLLLGIGAMLMVAPLTTTLMASVPARHAGVASAVNNAISRVGPQLAAAAIFVFVTASFTASLAASGFEPRSTTVQEAVDPLNTPSPDAPPDLVIAAREASTRGFHLAMWVCAGLFFAGAAVNAVGIRDSEAATVH